MRLTSAHLSKVDGSQCGCCLVIIVNVPVGRVQFVLVAVSIGRGTVSEP